MMFPVCDIADRKLGKSLVVNVLTKTARMEGIDRVDETGWGKEII